MTATQMYRWSGLSLVLGAILSAVSSIVSGVVFPDTSDIAAATNPLNVLLGATGVVGSMLALLGLPGLYARVAREGGLVWLAGVVLIALTGMLFGVFMGLMGVLVFPVLATQAPEVFRQGPPPSFMVVFILGTLANAVGALLMGIPMISRQIYPRWCGYLLMLEALLAVLSFVLSGPSSSGLLNQVLTIVSPLPLFFVVGWIGLNLWSGDAASREVARRPAAPEPV